MTSHPLSAHLSSLQWWMRDEPLRQFVPQGWVVAAMYHVVMDERFWDASVRRRVLQVHVCHARCAIGVPVWHSFAAMSLPGGRFQFGWPYKQAGSYSLNFSPGYQEHYHRDRWWTLGNRHINYRSHFLSHQGVWKRHRISRYPTNLLLLQTHQSGRYLYRICHRHPNQTP